MKIRWQQFKPWVAPTLVLIVAFGMATVATYFIQQVVTRQAEIQFENQTQIANSLIERRLESYTHVLYGVRGLFAASDAVGRTEFAAYISNIDISQHYPGISGLSFTRHLPLASVPDYVASVQSEGYSSFTIKPAGERSDYYVIDYTEPFNPDSAAFGFDLGTSPERLEAIERARNTGLLAATVPLELLNSTKNGFIIFMPLYDQATVPDNAEERRAHFLGAVNAVVDMDALFEPLLADLADWQLVLTVEDVNAKGRNRLYHSSDPARNLDLTMTQERTIDIGGRTWTINYQAEEYYDVSRADRLLYLISIILCYLFSLLSFIMTYLITSSQTRAHSVAQEILLKRHRT